MKNSSWKIYLAFFVGALFMFIALSFYPEFAHLLTSKEEKNKRLVLEAFDAAFNKKEAGAFERYWSEDYIQHSAKIPPGREGLKKAVESRPPNFHYEHGLIMAEGDYVMVHGRFSNRGTPRAILPWTY